MTIDSGWNIQAVTPLDLSAMAASENIASSNSDEQRGKATVFDDFLGGTRVPVAEVTELTNLPRFDSEGPGMPLRVSGSPTDYDSGLIRPVAASGEGNALDLARDYLGTNQLDRAYSSNLAAEHYIDQQYLGRIVDYVA